MLKMRVSLNHKLIFLLLITLFSVCSCDQQVECIDPDNWGGTFSTTISSTDTATTQITTIVENQTDAIDWTKSYDLDGNRVVMIVKNSTNSTMEDLNCSFSDSDSSTESNSWIPLFGDELDTYGIAYDSIEVCTFPSGTTPWCPANSSMVSDNISALNLLCKFNYGLGLYSTIATTTPNAITDFGCMVDGATDNNCFFHVGDSITINSDDTITSNFYDQGCPTAGLSFSPPTNSNTMTMYFKILDRYYTDNIGGYTVEFKQGVVNPSGGGIVTKFVGLVQLLLCNVTSGIYSALVAESDFTSYVRVLLLLYIIFLGFSSVMGFTQLTHKELLIRALKIGLIVQLISPTSWEFFNTYFFQLFTNGIGEIIGIIFGQGSDVAPVSVSAPWIQSSEACNFQTLAGFSAIDSVVTEVFSYETTRKVFSLLFWQIYGFIYIAIIYICLGVILFVLIKCILIYIVSFLIISILITLAPIFIPFMLFGITRNFFDNWLKALISYFVQPIIILTFAFFLLQIFMAQMQSMLGYRICWKSFVTIPIVEIQFYAWQYDFDNSTACIMTPNAILSYDSDSNNGTSDPTPIQPGEQLELVGSLNIENYPGTNSCSTTTNNDDLNNVCAAYTCSQERYVGYPYLDPNFQPDQSRIDELYVSGEDAKTNSPTLVSLKDLIVFIMIIWFMYHFSKMVPSIARQVARGTAFGGVNLGGVTGRWGGAMFRFGASTAIFGATPIYWGITRLTTGKTRSLKGDLRIARHTVRGLKERAQNAVGGRIEAVQSAVQKTRVATVAKWVLTPHKMIGRGLEKSVEKVGEKTLGRGVGALKAGASTVRRAIGTTIDEKILGRKHPEKISAKARLSQKQADEALAEMRNQQAAEAVIRSEIQKKRAKEKVARAEIRKQQALIDQEGEASELEKAHKLIEVQEKEIEKNAELIRQKEQEVKKTSKLIKQKKQEAYNKYREAAKEGSSKAMMALGHMYTQNEVSHPGDENLTPAQKYYHNLSEAYKLYDNASKAGDKAAIPMIAKTIMSMGRMHENNEILNEQHQNLAPEQQVYKNLSVAHNLYIKAFKKGNQKARPEIARVARKMKKQKDILNRKGLT